MAKKKSVFINILTISSLGVMAKILGVMREGVVAAYFGTSAQMDVFSMLSSIMNTIITIFAASASIGYFPLFVRNKEKEGISAASKSLSNMLNQYLLYSVSFYVLIFVLSPLMPRILGESVSSVDPQTVVLYTRLLFWTIITSGFSKVQLVALSALRDYGWLQRTTSLYSVISIVLTLLFGHKYGVGVLVAAFMVNSIIQLLILQFVLRRHDVRYKPYLNLKDKEINSIWKSLIPVFLGTEVYMLGLTIDRTLGLSLNTEGVVSAFNYSGILYGLVNNIIAVPIITVFNTELSERYFKGEISDFFKSLRNTIALVVIVLMPVVVFLSVDSYEFVYCALKRGAFNDQSVSITSSIFAIYVLISPIYAFRILMSRIFLLMDNRKTPMYSGILFLAVNVLFGYTLSTLFGVKGICFGSMCAMLFSAVFLFAVFKRKYSYQEGLCSDSAKKAIASSLLSLALVFVVKTLGIFKNVYLGFCVHALIYGMSYILFLKLFKVSEYVNVEQRIVSMLHRGR